ncbi:hypothetical protein GHNINEIG_02031 [Hydrogenovibrio crunogenus]|uniref:Lipoprotein n=1 Tax=Hydrogenovibrio crunogenus TaxID=39765 RepID=A0A4P7P3K0_9GAMM|nr:hypothetical protein [Hydrogenovibrio crunogenus]QBZ83962.1 hypothetical protein GHNINEIG_02031 [Hydrogenovibrio crunogenus]
MRFKGLTYLHKTYSLVAVGCVFVVLILGGCNSDFLPSNKQISQWPVNTSCKLDASACSTSVKNQSITLDIQPKPIRVARMLNVRVKLTGIEAEKVELDIAGQNMYMGYNRVTLTPVKGYPHLYEGQSMLAFCTNDKMDWHLSVLVTQKNQPLIQAPFALTTRSQ